MINSPENALTQELNFHAQLHAILSRPLEAAVIDTYADAALNDVVELVGNVTSYYNTRPTVTFGTAKETENAALNYYDLDNVEQILDHIAEKDSEVAEIDSLIAAAPVYESVILPPDEVPTVTYGEGDSAAAKQTIPRLKTVLFILKNEFGLDISNANEIGILASRTTPHMVRNEGYYSLTIPNLNRQLLICDEEGNATFVLDTKILPNLELTTDAVLGLTKNQLRELITNFPNHGQRLVYNSSFVPNIVAAIQNPASVPGKIDITPRSYLAPKPTAETLTISGIAKALGVNIRTVQAATRNLAEILSETDPEAARIGIGALGLEAIKHHLEDKGLFLLPKPEDYLPTKLIADRLGVANSSVLKAINALQENLGEGVRYKSASGRIAEAYSPDQQRQIIEYLKQENILLERAPEGYLTQNGMAKELGVSYDAVKKALNLIGKDMGMVNQYRFGSKVALGYAPHQQTALQQYFGEQGFYTEAPEGYTSLVWLSRSLNRDHRTVSEAIKSLSDQLGDIKKYRFNKSVTKCYSPEQQEKVKSYLSSLR